MHVSIAHNIYMYKLQPQNEHQHLLETAGTNNEHVESHVGRFLY